MIRLLEAVLSAAAWVGVSIMTVLDTLAILVIYLLRRRVDPELRLAHEAASLWGRSLMALAPGCRVEVLGRENLPRDRPVILMANHQSYVDVPALFFVRRQFKWMADVDLFRIPVFGWAMGWAGYVPVQRGDARAAIRSLEQAKRWLRNGISIFIFPEGTRSHTGVLGRFLTGGFRLAVGAQAPIVPVVVTGTRQLLPRGSWIFRWGMRVRIQILPPIQPGKGRGAVHPLAQQVRARVRQAYQEGLEALRRPAGDVLP